MQEDLDVCAPHGMSVSDALHMLQQTAQTFLWESTQMKLVARISRSTPKSRISFYQDSSETFVIRRWQMGMTIGTNTRHCLLVHFALSGLGEIGHICIDVYP